MGIHQLNIVWLFGLCVLSCTTMPDRAAVAQQLSPKAAVDLLQAKGVEVSSHQDPQALKSFVKVSLRKASISNDDLALLSSIPTLHYLDASGFSLTETGSRHIGVLKGLFILDLTGTKLSEDAVSLTTKDLSLKCLNLTATGITDAALKILVASPSSLTLKKILLRGDNIASDGLRSLSEIRSLQEVDLGFTNITLSDVSLLANLPLLSHLNLDGVRITPGGLNAVYQLPCLTFLHLDLRLSKGQLISDTSPGSSSVFAGIDRLSLLENLCFIVDEWHIHDADTPNLSALHNLKSLQLSGFQFAPQSIIDFGPQSCIVSLNLSNSDLDDRQLRSISGLAKVRSIDLSSTKVNGRCLALGNLESLDRLVLSNTRVSDNTLEMLDASKSLKSLDLAGAKKVTSQGMRHLVRHSRLRSLKLGWQDLRGDGLASLSLLPELQQLELRNCILDEASLVALGQLTHIKTLVVSHCRIPGRGFGTVHTSDLAFLSKLKSLHSLSLYGIVRSPREVRDPVAQLPNIVRLHGWEPRIPDAYLCREKLQILEILSASAEQISSWKESFDHALIKVLLPNPIAMKSSELQLKDLVLVQTRDVRIAMGQKQGLAKEVIHCYSGQGLLGNTRFIEISPDFETDENIILSTDVENCDIVNSGTGNLEIRAYLRNADSFNYVGHVFPDECIGTCPPNTRRFGYPWSASINALYADPENPGYYEVERFSRWFEKISFDTWPPTDEQLLDWTKTDDVLVSEFSLEHMVIRPGFSESSSLFKQLPEELKSLAREKLEHVSSRKP